MKINKNILVLIVLIIAFIFRAQINPNPPGPYVDESSLGYNAYSILKTGRDEYGHKFPVFFRSFNTYQSGLYSYSSIPFIKIFGLNIFSIRFVSFLSGLLLVLVTAKHIGLLEALIIAISPVFIFFSRAAFEANLALFIFIYGFILANKYKRNPKLTPFLLLSLSAYAYHAQRFLSVIFIIVFSLYGIRKKPKKSLVFFLLAILTQIPLFLVSFKSGTNSRFLTLIQTVNLPDIFKSYFSYLLPGNLFFRPDPDPQRSFPLLSTFYPWMFIFYVLAIYVFLKNNKWHIKKNLPFALLLLASPIPAAITKDYFSTIRCLTLFFCFSLIIAYCIKKSNSLTKLLLIPIIFISLFGLHRNFVLLKNERSYNWNYYVTSLNQSLNKYPDTPIVIDNVHIPPLYISFAFLNKDPPEFLWQINQNRLDSTNYYNNQTFNPNINYKNIQFRPIVWKQDLKIDQILVGPPQTISIDHEKEHSLIKLDTIYLQNGQAFLNLYQTNPKANKLQ